MLSYNHMRGLHCKDNPFQLKLLSLFSEYSLSPNSIHFLHFDFYMSTDQSNPTRHLFSDVQQCAFWFQYKRTAYCASDQLDAALV